MKKSSGQTYNQKQFKKEKLNKKKLDENLENKCYIESLVFEKIVKIHIQKS